MKVRIIRVMIYSIQKHRQAHHDPYSQAIKTTNEAIHNFYTY